MSAISHDEAHVLVTALKKCKGIADVHATMNDSPNWCQVECNGGSVEALVEMAKSLEYRSVVENVSRMISGSGVTLVGGDIPDNVQRHFQRNVSEFIPAALTMMTVLGFVPISWHLDPESMIPTFEVADPRTSQYHMYRNRLTKARVLLRWDTELNVYDALTEFYFISKPSAQGEINSIASMLLRDFETLSVMRREMEAEIMRPAQYVIQKRVPKVPQADEDAVEEALFGVQEQFGLRKRKRDALETTSITLNNERVDVLVVQEDFEVVGGNLEMTGQYGRESRRVQYEAERRAFSARLYQLMGVPADLTEERRRDTGMARQAADQAFNRAAARWAQHMGHCINKALEIAYPALFMEDDKTQERMHKQMMVRKAERVIEYLDRNADSDVLPDTYEELANRIRPPSPTAQDYRDLLADRIPTVRLEPDRRLSAEEIRTIRESTAFDDDMTRRLEAQALGMADVVQEEQSRPAKRRKNLLAPDVAEEDEEE